MAGNEESENFIDIATESELETECSIKKHECRNKN